MNKTVERISQVTVDIEQWIKLLSEDLSSAGVPADVLVVFAKVFIYKCAMMKPVEKNCPLPVHV